MSATRVTIASRIFPPEPGAAAYRLGSLARRLARHGAEVEVLTTTPPRGVPEGWGADGIRLRRWPVLRDRGGNVRGYLQYASFDVPLLARLLLSRRPDVVVVEPPPTTGAVVRIVGALRRVPYAYYAGDISSTAAAGIGVPRPVVVALRALERWAMRGAAVVLTVSTGVADDVRQLVGAGHRVVVVGTGVDTDTFRPLPHDGSTPTFVYAGTMSELQGAEVFVRAFGQIAAERPDARLRMYGQGVQTGRLNQLADAVAPGQVSFPGRVPGEVIAAELSRASAGLASLRPGMGYDYAYPTKMFAVTACGTPVIYAGPGPGHELVRAHGLGWACTWSPDEVAEAMRAALRRTTSSEESDRLAAWTRASASQDSVADKAATAVLGAAAARGVNAPTGEDWTGSRPPRPSA
ncbi:glycosyltransferase [Intrasporangium sp.]|uniref:glycosyltransferase n=1 Tax=Intrasporangium sp. TaxID=1925024 RepID=UPI003221F1E1